MTIPFRDPPDLPEMERESEKPLKMDSVVQASDRTINGRPPMPKWYRATKRPVRDPQTVGGGAEDGAVMPSGVSDDDMLVWSVADDAWTILDAPASDYMVLTRTPAVGEVPAYVVWEWVRAH